MTVRKRYLTTEQLMRKLIRDAQKQTSEEKAEARAALDAAFGNKPADAVQPDIDVQSVQKYDPDEPITLTECLRVYVCEFRAAAEFDEAVWACDSLAPSATRRSPMNVPFDELVAKPVAAMKGGSTRTRDGRQPYAWDWRLRGSVELTSWTMPKCIAANG